MVNVVTCANTFENIDIKTAFFYNDSCRLIDVSQLSGQKFSVFITNTCVLFLSTGQCRQNVN